MHKPLMLFVVLFGLVFSFPTLVLAQDNGGQTGNLVAIHLAQARVAWQNKDWTGAIVQLKRAYMLRHDPDIVLQIAEVYDTKMNDPANALLSYNKFLEDDVERKHAQRRRVEARVAELMKERTERETPSEAELPPTTRPDPLPDSPDVVIVDNQIILLDKVLFYPVTAKLDPHSLLLLDQMAAFLRLHQDIKRVSIGGHTAGTGSVSKNMKLSQDRADTVKAYLVHKGVDVSRLEAKGFGPFRPIADNSTERGRETNRRIDFLIISPIPDQPVASHRPPAAPASSTGSSPICRLAGDAGKNVDVSKKANWEWFPPGQRPNDLTTTSWWQCAATPPKIDALHEDRSQCSICELSR